MPYGEQFSGIIERWKLANPIACHGLGIHDFDGEINDMSPKAIEKRIKDLKHDISSLESMHEPVEKIGKYEYNLLLSTLRTELYELDVLAEYKDSPLAYVFSWYNPLSIIETSYTMREFASIDDRVRSIIKLEEKFPKYLYQAKSNLEGKKMASMKVTASINFLRGYISYFSDELIAFITQVKDDDLIQKWTEVNEIALKALKDFLNFLEESLESCHDQFALGEEKFTQILAQTEGVAVTAERLLEIGEKDLNRNLGMLQNLADKKTGGDMRKIVENIEGDTPLPSELLSYTEKTLVRTRQFLIDNDIVDIPSEEQCKAIFTPKSMRSFAFAAMNTPGPYEAPAASQSYYWVTPPDANWSREKVSEFMKLFNKSAFESITVHEAWPGHYLQLLFSNQTTSDIAKMFAFSYAMIEGWAHYAEEMIYEAGYEPFDREDFHVGQLLEALIRNVRYICAVKMHCRGMKMEEAKQMFIEKAFMSETNAEIEARRGTIDPMYLNYTLGKLMIKKLREDYKQEKGKAFSLKEFHNELLSYGSPPITVVRKMMLNSSTDDIL